MPPREEVLQLQGIPPGTAVPAIVDDVLCGATEMFLHAGQPRAMLRICHDRDEIDGLLETQEIPLRDILARAQRVALFAATLGARIEHMVDDLFGKGDLALAAMLDALASAAAEKAVDACGDRLARSLVDGGECATAMVMPYSPGYCGWPVQSQETLFSLLRPEPIGITLTASCMMIPRKSVSGVLAAAAPEVHRPKRSCPVCVGCPTPTCTNRFKKALRSIRRGVA